MTGHSESWVLCGTASHREAPEDALRISVGRNASTMMVDIGGIGEAMGGRLPDRFADLIRIAAFVLGADGAISRGEIDDVDNGNRWHRNFHLVVDVEDPSFWGQKEVRVTLEEVLGFLSQDSFAFEFVPMQGKSNAAEQLVFSGEDGSPFLPWDHVEEVSLFSGGLDSFSGAADLILAQRRSVILVSHLSATKMMARQTGLVGDLRDLAKANGCPLPVHVCLKVQRQEDLPRTERTQRTRSFLYGAIAGAVAGLAGRSRVTMHENGIVAINLPIAGSVVGARATRTAHPFVLHGFGKLLSLVGGSRFVVENPFVLKTRAEVIKALEESPALVHAKQTVSCGDIHHSSTMHPHCGVCSQCLDRQFGFRGADMADHDSELGYRHQLVTDDWTMDQDRSLLLSWISAADRYAECKNAGEFLGSFGDAARAVPYIMEACGLRTDDATRAVYDLHKRHGGTVNRVLGDINQRYAKQIRTGKLKADTLPMLLFHQGLKAGAADKTRTGSENRFVHVGREWQVRFRDGSAFSVPETKGVHYLSLLLASPGEMRSASGLVALSEGRSGEALTALDEKGKEAVRERVAGLKRDRELAQECGDDHDARRQQAQIDALEILLSGPASPPVDEKLVRLMERGINEAIRAVSACNRALGDHLKKYVRFGPVYWYSATGMIWRVVQHPAASAVDDGEWVSASQLVNGELHCIRNVREVGRFCKQQDVPTRPGKTKDGRVHKQRCEVHRRSFDDAMRRYRGEERHLQDAADRVLTAKLRREGK